MLEPKSNQTRKACANKTVPHQTAPKAMPNKVLDFHSNFVKNWGGQEVFILLFFSPTTLKNRTVLKETLTIPVEIKLST